MMNSQSRGVNDGSRYVSALAVAAALTMAGHALAGQCIPQWTTLGTGLDDEVRALIEYDGDVIAAGFFTDAGGVQANRVARWDGEEWHPLGDGVGEFLVYALVVHNGDLIAGGWFEEAGGVIANNIARWDGKGWEALGAGVDNPVYSLTVLGGDIIAGGQFTEAGGNPANRIARWDGDDWHALGDGMNGAVWALGVYDNELIAGGSFTTADDDPAEHIARWDGNEWNTVGAGVDGTVRSIAVFEGDLVVGGFFTDPANRIARWDGNQWHAFGTGMDNTVFALAEFDEDLVAAGFFTMAGGKPVNNIARWDGAEWEGIGAGLNSTVLAVVEHDDTLIAGGNFSQAGGSAASNIAMWGCFDIPEAPAPVGFITNPQPTFAWNAVADATWYQLWVRDSTGDVLIQWYTDLELNCVGGGVCFTTPDLQLATGPGKWWFRPWNAQDGHGAWSAAFDFNLNIAPPTLISPEGTIANPNQTYQWEEVEGSTWYRLWVRDSTGNVLIQWYDAALIDCDGATCSVTPDLTLAPGSGIWWVQGWNATLGQGLWSSGMTFNVLPIGAPQLVSPDGMIIDIEPTYTWETVPGATWYQLSVVDLSLPPGDPNRIVILQWYELGNSPVACNGQCEITPPVVLDPGDYKWWVRAWNAVHGNSPWSAGMEFTVVVP